MMLAQSSTSFLDLLQSIDGDVLAALFIVGTIGSLITLTVVIGMIASTIKNVAAMKMSHTMVKDLLNKGYSVDDTERLVYGGQPFGRKLQRIARAAKQRLQNTRRGYQNNPVPPMKQTA